MKASIFYNALVAASLALAVKPPSLEGMKLVWHDDFKGCTGCDLDLKQWEHRMHLDHNGELQEYTDSNNNAQLSGGHTLQIVPWKNSNGEWTSARVETLDSWTPTPGKKMRWQAGLRMGDAANRKGLWPAFWMLGDSVRHGTDWPMCGELDIFEQVNGVMEGFGTVHCGQDDNGGGACNEPQGRGSSVPIPNNDFNNWALQVDRTSQDWRQQSIQWFQNGVAFHTVTGADIGDAGVWSTLAHSPFYMIFNVAVGGQWPVRCTREKTQ